MGKINLAIFNKGVFKMALVSSLPVKVEDQTI
jgi:hypothetical protein